MTRPGLVFGGVAIVLVLAACNAAPVRDAMGEPVGGGGQGMMAGATMGPREMGPREMGTIAGVVVGAPECPAVDPKLVAQGRAIFTGAGNCQMCHGANAKGTPLAPDLTDATWLNIDGSYAAIAGLVNKGVPAPKKYPAPMPPMGGASLAAGQVCAVAAYVYSLGHPVH